MPAHKIPHEVWNLKYRNMENQISNSQAEWSVSESAEYDAAAEHFARLGVIPNENDSLPLNMGAGTVQHIAADVEAFQQRVRDIQYGIAMSAVAQ